MSEQVEKPPSLLFGYVGTVVVTTATALAIFVLSGNRPEGLPGVIGAVVAGVAGFFLTVGAMMDLGQAARGRTLWDDGPPESIAGTAEAFLYVTGALGLAAAVTRDEGGAIVLLLTCAVGAVLGAVRLFTDDRPRRVRVLLGRLAWGYFLTVVTLGAAVTAAHG